MDNKDLRRFQRDLKRFASRAYPFATKGTLNSGAFMLQTEARSEIASKLITRNRFTERRVLVDRATTLTVRFQRAATGHTEEYMKDQEFGGTAGSVRGKARPLPTTVASGEGRGARPRRRLPTRANKLESIRLTRGLRRGTSRRQRNAIAVAAARKANDKHVYLDLQGSKGLFRVYSGRIEMLHNLTRATYRIPARPWLQPATARVSPRMPGIFRKEMKKQLIRHRVFRR